MTDNLILFHLIAKNGSLSGAAREQGISLAAVSKRLSNLETRLGLRLVNRTTRRLSLTQEGEIYLERGRELIASLSELEESLSAQRDTKAGARGLLRVNATFGFGRQVIAPAVAEFARLHPQCQVQLELTDHYLNLTDSGFDVAICVGDLSDARQIAKRIGANQRVVCAAPSYWKRAGVPKVPSDLVKHDCIVLRQLDHAYGTWKFAKVGKSSNTGSRALEFGSVKVRGALTTNDGQASVAWALGGLGVILRSTWEVADHLRDGRLVQALADYATPDANIYAVYPERKHLSARVRLFVDFIAARIGQAFPL